MSGTQMVNEPHNSSNIINRANSVQDIRSPRIKTEVEVTERIAAHFPDRVENYEITYASKRAKIFNPHYNNKVPLKGKALLNFFKRHRTDREILYKNGDIRNDSDGLIKTDIPLPPWREILKLKKQLGRMPTGKEVWKLAKERAKEKRLKLAKELADKKSRSARLASA